MRVALVFVLLVLVMPLSTASITLPILSPTMASNVPAAMTVALDSHGNIVLGANTGRYAGDVRKLDSQGALQWERTFPDWTGNVMVAVDSQDAVLASAGPGILRKYDPNGNLLWQATVPGTTSYTQVLGIALDASDNAYVLLGQNPGLGVGKVTSNGVGVWSSIPPTSPEEVPRAIAASPDGHVAAASTLRSFGFDQAGTVTWIHSVPGNAIAMDAEGNTYVGAVNGYNRLADILGPLGYTVKYAPDGTTVWTQPQPANALVNDGGSIIAVSMFYGGIAINPLPELKGFDIDALDPATGYWTWGFRHISGTWTHGLDVTFASTNARNGLLAFTSPQFDTPVYRTDSTLRACDSANPVASTPALARACAFTPV